MGAALRREEVCDLSCVRSARSTRVRSCTNVRARGTVGGMSGARSVAAVALLALGACVSNAREIGTRDPRQLGPGEIAIVGRIQLFVDGVDRTGRTAIETNAPGVSGYTLASTGQVAWVVPKVQGPVRLLWLSSFDDQLSLGEGPVLAPADAQVPMVYFGSIVVRVSHSAGDDLANAVVGMSRPKIEIEVVDETDATFAPLVQANPSLAGVRYLHMLEHQERAVSSARR